MKKLLYILIISGSFNLLIACSDSEKKPVYDTVETVLLQENFKNEFNNGSHAFYVYNYTQKGEPYSYKVLFNNTEVTYVDWNDNMTSKSLNKFYSIRYGTDSDLDQMAVHYSDYSGDVVSTEDVLTIIEVFTYIKEYK